MQGGCSVVLSTSGWWILFEMRMRKWRKIIENEDAERDETERAFVWNNLKIKFSYMYIRFSRI